MLDFDSVSELILETGWLAQGPLRNWLAPQAGKKISSGAARAQRRSAVGPTGGRCEIVAPGAEIMME